jgi:hypothetical protein
MMKSWVRFVWIAAGCLAAVALASTLVVGGERTTPTKPQEAVLTGTVTDLHTFMSGEAPNKETTRQRVYEGVPVILQTEAGPIILGKGKGSLKTMVLGVLHQPAEVKGLLYAKHGLRYLDVAVAKPPKPGAQPIEDDEWIDEPEDDQQEDIDDESDDFRGDEDDPY